ncbi:membrane protein [Ensifer adhaerens]|uniref:Membrane protein n=1 Tax=Ensifer adhaerens TaxID=106592 RepID=A0A0L8BXV1_ENSAD|nr:YoaK family protein [Ensifer adhaerens]KOF19522.1 membrane protein [Ensifer adhaerens]
MTFQRRRRIIKRQRTGTALLVVALISFLAGMTDAIGLLTVGDFVSFMSGNTTRAATAIADGNILRSLILLGSLAVFVIGNAMGTIVASRFRAGGVLCCVTLILTLAAAGGDHLPNELRFYFIVLAMGVVNASVEHIEGLPIGLTYVTGALSRFGRGLGRWIIGTGNMQWTIQIVPWIGMLGGAVIGAILEHRFGQFSLWAPAILAGLLCLLVLMIPGRWSRRYAQR